MIALDNCNTTLYDLWLVIIVNISKHYRYLVADLYLCTYGCCKLYQQFNKLNTFDIL